MTSNKAKINIAIQGGRGQGEPATLEKKRFQGPHSLPWQALADKDPHKILYVHIPLHNLRPSASCRAGLYYLPALTPPPLKSVSSALTSNHQTLYTAPLPREPLSPLDFLITRPDSLSFSTANCFANKVSWIESIRVGTEILAIRYE
jgi:hypothetical protein